VFVSPGIGFWIVVLLLGRAAVLNLILAPTERPAAPTADGPERPVAVAA
jgi:hypothetical protein